MKYFVVVSLASLCLFSCSDCTAPTAEGVLVDTTALSIDTMSVDTTVVDTTVVDTTAADSI
jgi:hypothetical protein